MADGVVNPHIRKMINETQNFETSLSIAKLELFQFNELLISCE